METVVGIDLGGTNIVGERVDPDGNTMTKGHRAARPERGGEAVLADIVDLAKELADDTTRAVGVGSPGLVDSTAGVIAGAVSNIPGWQGMNVCTPVSEATGVPAFLGNDANMAALSEAWLGAARDSSLVLLFTLGTGIGGGIVYNGRVIEGVSGVAAEFGHLCLYPDGEVSASGVRGIWEHYASASALERCAREYCAGHSECELAKRADGDPEKITAKLVCDLAREGIDSAAAVLDEVAGHLAVGLGTLINIFNPGVIVLAGGMALAGDVLFDRIHARLAESRALDISLREVRIVPAALGDRAGVVGAAKLAWNRVG